MQDGSVRYTEGLAETLNGLDTAAVIHRKSGQGLGKEAWATLTWVDRFNHRRLLEPVGYTPPAKAEAAYYRQLTESARVAGLTAISLRNSRGGSYLLALGLQSLYACGHEER